MIIVLFKFCLDLSGDGVVLFWFFIVVWVLWVVEWVYCCGIGMSGKWLLLVF